MPQRAILVALALTTCSIFSVAQRPGFDSRNMQQSRMNSPFHEHGSITGTVRGTDGKPLKDVRVELNEASNGTMINAVYSNSSGSFEFSQVPGGVYRIVATAGLQRAEERIEVSSFAAIASLRMPVSSTPTDGNDDNSISVSQYKVPAKARNEFHKARELTAKGKLDEAQKYVAKALEIYPNYADALTLRAVLELNAKNTEVAVTDLQKAIECDGNYAMAYMVLGSALNVQAKFDDAIRALQRGETLAPNYWQAYFELGKAYIGKADYSAAIRQLNQAQTMAPADYPLIYLVRAHALLALNQYSDAMTDLQAYLQKDPNGTNSAQAQKMLEKAQAFVAPRK